MSPRLLYVAANDLEVAYQQMAQDEAREAEALKWAAAIVGDLADQTLPPEIQC